MTIKCYHLERSIRRPQKLNGEHLAVACVQTRAARLLLPTISRSSCNASTCKTRALSMHCLPRAACSRHDEKAFIDGTFDGRGTHQPLLLPSEGGGVINSTKYLTQKKKKTDFEQIKSATPDHPSHGLLNTLLLEVYTKKNIARSKTKKSYFSHCGSRIRRFWVKDPTILGQGSDDFGLRIRRFWVKNPTILG